MPEGLNSKITKAANAKEFNENAFLRSNVQTAYNDNITAARTKDGGSPTSITYVQTTGTTK